MATYGGISKLYILQISIYLFFCFAYKVCRTKTEQSDVATYGRISKLYIIQIRFYLFFCFAEKVRGTKAEQSDVATYGSRIHVYIFSGYSLSSQLWLHMAVQFIVLTKHRNKIDYVGFQVAERYLIRTLGLQHII